MQMWYVIICLQVFVINYMCMYTVETKSQLNISWPDSTWLSFNCCTSSCFDTFETL